MDLDRDKEYIYPHFTSKCIIDQGEDNIVELIDMANAKIKTSSDDFLIWGSHWELVSVLHLECHSVKCVPIEGSSFFPLPPKCLKRKSALNIQNSDENCLVWCLLAHKMNMDRKDHAERLSHYLPHEHEIKLSDVQCPIPVARINKIEQLNIYGFNIFDYEAGEAFPLQLSEKTLIVLISFRYLTKRFITIASQQI